MYNNWKHDFGIFYRSLLRSVFGYVSALTVEQAVGQWKRVVG